MSSNQESIPLFEIDWNESDIQSVTDSITRGGYWAKGPYVDELEQRLEQYLNIDHALVVNSGTTALTAALRGSGVGEGDEVIVPSFTFIATANAVRLTGAEPVFADIETQTYGLSPSDVESKITDATAAILPVHCYGTSCRIQELTQIAEDHGVLLIEDAAEVLGAEYQGKKLGTFGDAAALSFCQNKITPTGEGGAVVTDDEEIAKQVKLYRSHGRASEDYFESSGSGEYVAVGTNIRMSDMTAALGCSQLDRIDTLIERRQSVASTYAEYLSDVDNVTPHQTLQGATHVYQLYTVELDTDVSRQNIIQTLENNDIASKVYWDPPAHLTNYYSEYMSDIPKLPKTRDIAGRVLSLPMHPGLSEESIRRVTSTIDQAVKSE